MIKWGINGVRPKPLGPGAKPAQDGYAIMLVLFFLALLAVSLEVAQQNVIVEGRREKEREMIWRGRQYARGIRLYYQKNLRYPSNLEDLSKPKLGVRYMRQAYKDPMNVVDGSWRLISVAPNGMIVGSLRKHDLNLFGTKPSDAGTPLSAPPTGGLPNTFSSSFSSSTNPQSPSSSAAGAQGQTKISDGSSPNATATGDQANQSTNSPGANPIGSSPDATPAGANSGVSSPGNSADTGPAAGISLIIGVGSKVDKKSVIWLDGENNYLEFEFIFGLNNRKGNSTAGVVPDP